MRQPAAATTRSGAGIDILLAGRLVGSAGKVIDDLPDWARNSPALRSGCVAGAIDSV